MGDRKLAKRYASAIFDLAKSDDELREIYEVLNSAMVMYTQNTEFRTFVLHPLISQDEKEATIMKLFVDVADKYRNILCYIARNGRMTEIKSILIEYLKIYYEKNKIVNVIATFASDITDDQRARLTANLEKKLGKKINLNIKKDPTLIGGGIIKLEGKVIDGSVKNQLKNIKNTITKSNKEVQQD